MTYTPVMSIMTMMVIMVRQTVRVMSLVMTTQPADEEERDAEEDLGAEGPAELR